MTTREGTPRDPSMTDRRSLTDGEPWNFLGQALRMESLRVGGGSPAPNTACRALSEASVSLPHDGEGQRLPAASQPRSQDTNLRVLLGQRLTS